MTQSQEIQMARVFAELFDLKRHCGWNNDKFYGERIAKVFSDEKHRASDILEYRSMGSQCHGTILELALLKTLEPCKDCGGDHLYVGDYSVACCSCAGPMSDPCEDCQDGGCRNYIENANLQDAITAWNLHNGEGSSARRNYPLTIIF